MTAGSTMARLTLGEVLRIAEFRTKIVSLSSFLIGTTYAAGVSGRVAWDRAVLMGVATLCIDLATASFNSYYDFVRGVDRPDTDVARYKVLVQRPVSPSVALWIACGCFLLAAIPGAWLGVVVGWQVVAIGAACMAVSYLYSGGPYPLASTPVGEVFAGGMLGNVLVALAAYVQLEALPRGAVVLGVPSSCIIAAILAVNNACDARGDARAGRRTFAIVVGPVGAGRFVVLLVAATYATAFGLVGVAVLRPMSWLPLTCSAAVAVTTLSLLCALGYSHATKPAAMGEISRAFLAYTVAMLVALALGAVRA